MTDELLHLKGVIQSNILLPAAVQQHIAGVLSAQFREEYLTRFMGSPEAYEEFWQGKSPFTYRTVEGKRVDVRSEITASVLSRALETPGLGYKGLRFNVSGMSKEEAKLYSQGFKAVSEARTFGEVRDVLMASSSTFIAQMATGDRLGDELDDKINEVYLKTLEGIPLYDPKRAYWAPYLMKSAFGGAKSTLRPEAIHRTGISAASIEGNEFIEEMYGKTELDPSEEAITEKQGRDLIIKDLYSLRGEVFAGDELAEFRTRRYRNYENVRITPEDIARLRQTEILSKNPAYNAVQSFYRNILPKPMGQQPDWMRTMGGSSYNTLVGLSQGVLNDDRKSIEGALNVILNEIRVGPEKQASLVGMSREDRKAALREMKLEILQSQAGTANVEILRQHLADALEQEALWRGETQPEFVMPTGEQVRLAAWQNALNVMPERIPGPFGMVSSSELLQVSLMTNAQIDEIKSTERRNRLYQLKSFGRGIFSALGEPGTIGEGSAISGAALESEAETYERDINLKGMRAEDIKQRGTHVPMPSGFLSVIRGTPGQAEYTQTRTDVSTQITPGIGPSHFISQLLGIERLVETRGGQERISPQFRRNAVDAYLKSDYYLSRDINPEFSAQYFVASFNYLSNPSQANADALYSVMNKDPFFNRQPGLATNVITSSIVGTTTGDIPQGVWHPWVAGEPKGLAQEPESKRWRPTQERSLPTNSIRGFNAAPMYAPERGEGVKDTGVDLSGYYDKGMLLEGISALERKRDQISSSPVTGSGQRAASLSRINSEISRLENLLKGLEDPARPRSQGLREEIVAQEKQEARAMAQSMTPDPSQRAIVARIQAGRPLARWTKEAEPTDLLTAGQDIVRAAKSGGVRSTIDDVPPWFAELSTEKPKTATSIPEAVVSQGETALSTPKAEFLKTIDERYHKSFNAFPPAVQDAIITASNTQGYVENWLGKGPSYALGFADWIQNLGEGRETFREAHQILLAHQRPGGEPRIDRTGAITWMVTAYGKRWEGYSSAVYSIAQKKSPIHISKESALGELTRDVEGPIAWANKGGIYLNKQHKMISIERAFTLMRAAGVDDPSQMTYMLGLKTNAVMAHEMGHIIMGKLDPEIVAEFQDIMRVEKELRKGRKLPSDWHPFYKERERSTPLREEFADQFMLYQAGRSNDAVRKLQKTHFAAFYDFFERHAGDPAFRTTATVRVAEKEGMEATAQFFANFDPNDPSQAFFDDEGNMEPLPEIGSPEFNARRGRSWESFGRLGLSSGIRATSRVPRPLAEGTSFSFGTATYNQQGMMDVVDPASGTPSLPPGQAQFATELGQRAMRTLSTQAMSAPGQFTNRELAVSIATKINRAVDDLYSNIGGEFANNPEITARMKEVTTKTAQTILNTAVSNLVGPGANFSAAAPGNITAATAATLPQLMQAIPALQRYVQAMGSQQAALNAPSMAFQAPGGGFVSVGEGPVISGGGGFDGGGGDPGGPPSPSAGGGRGGIVGWLRNTFGNQSGGIWNHPIGRFMYGMYVARRFWGWTMQPELMAAGQYAENQAMYGDYAALQTGEVPYQARAAARMGIWQGIQNRAAWQEYGGFSEFGAVAGNSWIAQLMSSSKLGAGLIGGGAAAAGLGGLIPAGSAMGGIAAAAGPIVAGAGLLALGASGVMAARNALYPDAQPWTFGNAFTAGIGKPYYEHLASLRQATDADLSLRERVQGFVRGASGTWAGGTERSTLEKYLKPSELAYYDYVGKPATPEMAQQKETIKALANKLGLKEENIFAPVFGTQRNLGTLGANADFVESLFTTGYMAGYQPGEYAQMLEGMAGSMGIMPGTSAYQNLARTMARPDMSTAQLSNMQLVAQQVGRYGGALSGYFVNPNEAYQLAARYGLLTQGRAQGAQQLLGAMDMMGMPGDTIVAQLRRGGVGFSPYTTTVGDQMARMAGQLGTVQSGYAASLGMDLYQTGMNPLAAISAYQRYGYTSQAQVGAVGQQLELARQYGYTRFDPTAFAQLGGAMTPYAMGQMAGVSAGLYNLGYNPNTVADVLGQVSGMPNAQVGLLSRVAGGDLSAMSWHSYRGGPVSMRMLDRTGQPVYESDYAGFVNMAAAQAFGGNQAAQRMFGAEYAGGGWNSWSNPSWMGMAAGYQGAITPQNLQGLWASWGVRGDTSAYANAALRGYRGLVGMPAISLQHSDTMYGLQMASAGVAMQGVALQRRYLWGGGLGGSYGSPTAGSLWGMEDQMRQLNYTQQMGQFAYSEQMLGVRNQFAQEQEQQQWARMGTSVGFQRWSRGFEYSGMLMQRQWQREDWAYQQQMTNLQYSWNLEDINEQLKYATGRERRGLLRDRERVTTRYNLEQDQTAKTQSRQEQVWNREDERFRKQTEYQERLMQLETTSFEMSKRQRETIFKMERDHLSKQVDDYQEQYDLQSEIIQVQREFQAKQLELQAASAGIQAAMAAEQKKYNDTVLLTQEHYKGIRGEYEEMVKNDPTFILQALKSFAIAVSDVPLGNPQALSHTVDTISKASISNANAVKALIDAINGVNTTKIDALIDLITSAGEP